jgi:hypothetical protein
MSHGKHGTSKMVKGADMNVPAEKINYIQSSSAGRSGGMYKAPSMGKIQYGMYEKPEVKKGQGKGMSMKMSQLSKYMARNRMKK